MTDSRRARSSRRRDTPRILAITSQAVGFILIILFETLLPEPLIRPAQGITLAVMLAAALWSALLRRYHRNRSLKQRDHGSCHEHE
ncbi:hypothetical protein [Kushneria aurantia]|uniref:Uncharacterized protein n=1 Tax=Kushneria aurantia TaxID=504092 RepID=A0ABV6G5N3_9GAMM|nr:hypothetical protein [Kushneria aurantia]